MKKNKSIKRLALIALLGTISGVLMLMEFPLPFLAPSFYQLDLSEVPVMIGAFAYGPLAGLAIEVVKIFLKLIIKPTMTMGVGEIANFLIGITLVIPASYIYNLKKTKKRAIVGLAIGTVAMAGIGAFINAFVMLPFFATLMSSPENIVTVSDFVAMGTAINPLIKNVTSLMLFAVVPFNILKGLIVSVIVLLIYKRLSPLLKAEDSEEEFSGCTDC